MKVLLAIPVYNEAEHVQGVLSQVRPYVRDILVVDDGSDDQTPELLDGYDGIRVIHHPTNLGYGRALRSAFRYAIDNGYDWVITMDCDGQHEPSFLPKFLEAAARDDADIVSGSRYLRYDSDDDAPPPDRQAINAEITALLNERLRLGVTDAFCGFKAYRVSSLRRLRITEDGYAMPLQLWVQAARLGLRISEISVRLVYADPNRSFGGRLDEAEFRRRHYLAVFEAALAEQGACLAGPRAKAGKCDCRC